MQMPVRIRWAIVEGKGLTALLFPEAIVEAHVFPFLQPFRFAFWQTSPHREIGFWKVQSLFIIGRFGAHGLVSLGREKIV